jgi:hypothetical protein
MIGDAREHTAQLALGIEVEHLAGLSNPKDGATRSLPARVEAEEDKNLLRLSVAADWSVFLAPLSAL